MTEQAIIYFIHSFFHPNMVTDPRICQLPCQSQKWISHVLPVHPGYLKFHIFILETLLSPSRPIYQYFPSPAPQKTTPPLSRLLHLIKLHCHPPSCSCQKPKSLPSIYSFFSHCILPAYKQILSILSSKHTPKAFTSLPLYCLLCNPSHHHLSHGLLQPLPMTSSSHSSQSSTFF